PEEGARYGKWLDSVGFASKMATSIEEVKEHLRMKNHPRIKSDLLSNDPLVVFVPQDTFTTARIAEKINTFDTPRAKIVSISPKRKTQDRAEPGIISVSLDDNLFERLKIRTPEISWEKQALIERMASRTVVRLE